MRLQLVAALTLLLSAGSPSFGEEPDGTWKPQLTIEEAVKIAKAEVKRRGIKDADYHVVMARFHYESKEWIVHFDQSKTLILDADIMVRVDDRTKRACYSFGIGEEKCA